MRFQCPFCRGIVAVENSDLGIDVQCGYCGEIVTVPYSRVATGAVIADFIILEELGRGGMGVVYLTHQISLDRPAALKVLSDTYANNAEFVVNFIKEARAAAKLNHPHIVQAYAVGEDEGIFYFAMENIDGETMKNVIKREKVISIDRSITIIQQIAEALDYAWKEQRLIHRDIKPDNIMLTKNGRAKLADLGLSRVAGEIDDSNDDEVMGTPQYISPEHLTGAPMDIRSDIYSLGATFYHFVTGKFPFEGRTASEIARKHLDEKLVPPNEFNPDVPESVSKIVVKMMEKSIKDRYQDAAELVDDLRMVRRSKLPSSSSGNITGSFKRSGSKTERALQLRNTKGSKTGQFTLSKSATSDILNKNLSGSGSHSFNASGNPEETLYMTNTGKSSKAIIITLLVLIVVLIAGGASAYFIYKQKEAKRLEEIAKKEELAKKEEIAKKEELAKKEEITKKAQEEASKKKMIEPLPANATPFMKKMHEILSFINTNPNKEGEFLKKCEELFSSSLVPFGQDEKDKLNGLKGLYVEIDEKRLDKLRKAAKDKYDALIADKKTAEEKRSAADKIKAEKERKEKELQAKKDKAEQEKKEQMEKKISEYVGKIESDKNLMRRTYIDLVKRNEFKRARDTFASSHDEPAKAKDNYPEIEKAAADFDAWGKKMQEGVDLTEKLHKMVTDSGTKLSGSTVEIKSGMLGKIVDIRNGNITVKSLIDSKITTVPVSELEVNFLAKLLKKASEKVENGSEAAFYYLLNNGEFTKARDYAPGEDWKKELSDTAYEYFKLKLSFAPEKEKDALARKFGGNSDYRRAKKDSPHSN